MINTSRGAVDMKRTVLGLTIVGILASGITVRAQNPARSRGANEAKVRTELMQIERDIGTANVKRDKAYFDRIEGDEFLFTGANGSLTTKKEDLASLDEPEGDWALDAYDPDDMNVYVYGTSAVVFGRTTTKMHNRKNSETRSSETRFTDVFVHRDGRWQIVAGHSSRIPPKKP